MIVQNDTQINLQANGLNVTHLATSYESFIPLNSKEIQLATDKTETLNDSWTLMCDSVYSRLGIYIEENFEIDFITVNGIKKAFH